MRTVLSKLFSVASFLLFLCAIVIWFDPAGYAGDFYNRSDLRPEVTNLLAWTLVLAAAPAWVFVSGVRLRRRRLRRGQCTSCGYDLRGTPLPRCSECGLEFARSVRILPRVNAGMLVAVLLVVCVVALCAAWEHIPGTLRQDRNGFPHGTGTMRFYYDSGALMLVERFKAGIAVEHTWYKPDGSVVASTKTPNGTGVGYYLRQDGSIRMKMEYVDGLAHGPPVYYDRDGSVHRRVIYKNGSPAEGSPPPWDGP